jgi:large subunit ribosomal protein L32
MGNPKLKTTKSKQGQRRSHLHAESMSSGKCDNCGEVKQSHIVCPSCGHYRKREVIKKGEL